MAEKSPPRAKEKRLKFREVYNALKGLEAEWGRAKSKKMQRALAIEKVQAIRKLITREFRVKPKTDAK
jgi:hypothetical protein